MVGVVLHLKESRCYEPEKPCAGERTTIRGDLDGGIEEMSRAEVGTVMLFCLPLISYAALGSPNNLCSRALLGKEGRVPRP